MQQSAVTLWQGTGDRFRPATTGLFEGCDPGELFDEAKASSARSPMDLVPSSGATGLAAPELGHAIDR